MKCALRAYMYVAFPLKLDRKIALLLILITPKKVVWENVLLPIEYCKSTNITVQENLANLAMTIFSLN